MTKRIITYTTDRHGKTGKRRCRIGLAFTNPLSQLTTDTTIALGFGMTDEEAFTDATVKARAFLDQATAEVRSLTYTKGEQA